MTVMAVRITQSMLSQNMLRNLNRSYSAMDKYQDQLSTGKKINKPSDDPVTAARGMFYRSTVLEIDQYKRNASDGLSWIEITDDALDQVTKALHRVKELTVQGSNGSYEPTALQAIAKEIQQLKSHIIEISNTTIGDRYIFAGTKTKEKPQFDNPDDTKANEDPIQWEVGQGSFIKVNVIGKDLFPPILTALQNIADQLDAGQSPADQLTELDNQLDRVLQERAVVGSNMNRMEMMLSRLENVEITSKKLLSETEDADIARVITELMEQENVHRAALSAGSRIIQPTLVDFLR